MLLEELAETRREEGNRKRKQINRYPKVERPPNFVFPHFLQRS